MNPSREKRTAARALPSAEDILEMSDVETLHPGGFDISRRIGELADLIGVRVLDVSSGKGVSACFYGAQFGSEVTGVEISEEFLAIARKRADETGVSDRVHFKAGDSRALPFPDDSFDVVINECAVGLTAIGAPQQVLNEMARVTKPGGRIVIHESTWLKPLPSQEREWAALRLGTAPCAVQEWQQMLVSAGVSPQTVEDWSGIENLLKIRPGHKWDPADPTGFLTWREKLTLVPRIAARYGVGAILDLYRSLDKLKAYFTEGYLGYTLIVASKDSVAESDIQPGNEGENSHE